ncbi:hypothetical protein [Synechococcus sp. BO 8801]|uniref:hypothetical protein n=1 Tax=Synechococcus sp. BO 8801 TaxID=169670 RepID=UPI000B98C060|nr:hypothetical protein [Synechococcus sp. BO 8801]
MKFRSEITIRMPDGVFLPPFVVLHQDTEIFSAVTFLRAMGNQIAWHQNGNLYGLQLLIDPIPEHASGGHALPVADMNRPAGPLDPVSVPAPSEQDLNDVFSFLDSPACCPNGAHKP